MKGGVNESVLLSFISSAGEVAFFRKCKIKKFISDVMQVGLLRRKGLCISRNRPSGDWIESFIRDYYLCKIIPSDFSKYESGSSKS